MPSKNRVKIYDTESFYHIYNRGIESRRIFLDDRDYRVFLSMLKRHLTPEDSVDQRGRVYENLSDQIELVAYCLMPTHFHLMIYQKNETGITKLMSRVATAYVSYFNRRHKRIGPLFQDIYKAALIDNDAYLMHISRYIHLNPSTPENYEYSSYQYFLGSRKPLWINPIRVLVLFEGDYGNFVKDFADHKKSLSSISQYIP